MKVNRTVARSLLLGIFISASLFSFLYINGRFSPCLDANFGTNKLALEEKAEREQEEGQNRFSKLPDLGALAKALDLLEKLIQY